MKRRDSLKGITAITGAIVAPTGAGNFLFSQLASAQSPYSLPDTSRLPKGGINLSGITYYDTSLPFNQVANMGHQWATSYPGGSWNTKEEWLDGALDDNGYPAMIPEGKNVKTMVFLGNGEHYPLGTYRLEWDGVGELSVMNAKRGDSGDQWSLWKVEQVHGQGIPIVIHSTNSDDHVRNIRLWTPEYLETGSYFRQGYLDDIKNYGVLRFMDWNHTNNSDLVSWEDRAQLGDAHWQTSSVPIEIMIDLCNAAGKDFYFTCGHLVDDDYILQLGNLVKERLSSGLKFWFAYSNECWNTSFSQTRYVREVLTPKYGYNPDKPDFHKGQAYGRRSAECAIILRPILGDQMIHVIEGWANGPNWTRQALEGCVEGGVQPDTGSITTYFGIRKELDDLYISYLRDAYTSDQVFDAIERDIARISPMWAENKSVCDDHGIPMTAYEGGPHITPTMGYSEKVKAVRTELGLPLLRDNGKQRVMRDDDSDFVQLLADLNEHSRMADSIDLMFHKWNEIGGKTVCWYNDFGGWGKYGSWGLKEHWEQDSTVKFDAVQRYLT